MMIPFEWASLRQLDKLASPMPSSPFGGRLPGCSAERRHHFLSMVSYRSAEYRMHEPPSRPILTG